LRKTLFIAAAVLLLAGSALFMVRATGNRGADSGRRNRGAIAYPVAVEPVTLQPLSATVTAVGALAAFEEVQVAARVGGTIDRVLFAEGATVARGAVVAEIETARYRLALATARAARDKAAARLANLEAGLARREAALQQGLVAREDVDNWRADMLMARAELAEAAAALDAATLNLNDAYVRAPISGIMQTRTVQTGQYVAAGAVLGTLQRRDPLLLRFTVPEADARQLQTGAPVTFTVRDDNRGHTAVITHLGAAADAADRAVAAVAAVSDSAARDLRPGTFAEITIAIGDSRAAMVVPLAAVRPSERGFIAYVVAGDTAVERVVATGLHTADGKVEITSGLQPGERLVVRGAEALRDGAPVTVAGSAGAAPARRASR